MALNDHEKRIFEGFRTSYAKFPPGEIDDSGESPDFIVRHEDRVIGIEHTDLYWASDKDHSPFQEGESLRKRIVKKLEKLLEQSKLPPIQVLILWNFRAKYSKKKVSAIANELFELVEKYLPAVHSTGEKVVREELPEQVHVFELERRQGFDFFDVTAPETSWIPRLERADLQRVIERKETKLPLYRRRANEIWLLISIGTGSMATLFIDKDPFVYGFFSTQFDRVFVFREEKEEVVELGIVKCAL